jgi:hypothetical protein
MTIQSESDMRQQIRATVLEGGGGWFFTSGNPEEIRLARDIADSMGLQTTYDGDRPQSILVQHKPTQH